MKKRKKKTLKELEQKIKKLEAAQEDARRAEIYGLDHNSKKWAETRRDIFEQSLGSR